MVPPLKISDGGDVATLFGIIEPYILTY